MRWRQAWWTRRTTAVDRRCSVQRTVVTWVHRNIIVLAATAWLESLCQRGRVVVVVHCSAVECDHCTSQWPTRDLHCPVISEEANWRQWMFSVDDHWRRIHSPTHTHTPTVRSGGKYFTSTGNWEYKIRIWWTLLYNHAVLFSCSILIQLIQRYIYKSLVDWFQLTWIKSTICS